MSSRARHSSFSTASRVTFTRSVQAANGYTWRQGVAIATATFGTASGGNGTYALSSVTPPMPAGLAIAFSGATLQVTGTPTVAGVSTLHTIIVTDTSHSVPDTMTTVEVRLTVVVASINQAVQPWTQNTAITPFVPIIGSGGQAPYTYGVAPTLPSGMSIASATGSVSGTPTVAQTSTTFTVTVTDSVGGTGGSAVNSFTASVTASGPNWSSNPPNLSFTQGTGIQTYSLAQHVTGFNSALYKFVVTPTGPQLPAWITLNATTGLLSIDTTNSGTVSNVTYDIADIVVASDWTTRISGPNVVWYHSFDTAAEVNQFRFTNSVAGNDPNNVGTNGTPPVQVASGGADGGGFMRLTYPLNISPDTSYWARPFFPIDAAGNGRGIADPGASGTIATQSWNFPQGGTTGFDVLRRTNPGFYGPAGRQALFPAKFQGTDYWLQIRVRRAQTPGKPPDEPPPGFTSINGKFVWFTCTGASFVTGEIVTFGQSSTTPHVPPDGTFGDQVGVQSYTNAYTFTGDFSTISQKTGGTVNVNNETIGWRYTGGWDTLLFHVTPGEIGGTGNQRTRFEVWAQRNLTQFPAEAGTGAKIWDVFFPAAYQTDTDSAGGQYAGGWNCLNLAIYHNLTTFVTSSFSYDFDQVIFIKGDGTSNIPVAWPTS